MSRTVQRSRRAGMIIHEAVVAISLLVVVMVAATQLLAVAAQRRRAADQHACAVREAGNVMDQLMACGWAELEARAAAVRLSAAAARQLPAARLTADVVPAEESEQTKQIAIRIDWQHAPGQQGRPIQLVAWRHRIAAADGEGAADEPSEEDAERSSEEGAGLGRVADRIPLDPPDLPSRHARESSE